MAKEVTVTITHDLGIEEAKRRIDERFDNLKASIAGNMGLKFEQGWEGDRLNFRAKGMGMNIPGTIDVFPEHVRIEMVLPTLLANMAEALRGKVEKQGQLMLDDQTDKA